jgi:hypothetical protein
VQLRGEEREHRVRVGEDHRGQVGQVGAEEVTPADRVPQADQDLPQGRPFGELSRFLARGFLHHGRQLRQPAQHHERDREPGRVKRVDQPGPGGDGKHAAKRGADEHARVRGQRHDRGGRRQLIARHDARGRRLERGPLQRGERHHQPRDHVQRPQQGMRQQRVEQQQHRARGKPGLAPAHQRPPVEPVGEHATVQPEHHQRHQLRQPKRPHDQRRPGDPLRLDEQGDLRRLRPEVRHRPAGEHGTEAARSRTA